MARGVGDYDDGARCMVDHLLTHRAKQQAPEPAQPTGPHDDEVSPSGTVENSPRRQVANGDEGCLDRRVGAHPLQSGGDESTGIFLAEGGVEGGPIGYSGLVEQSPRQYDFQMSVPQLRFLHGEAEGAVGSTRTVNSHNYALSHPESVARRPMQDGDHHRVASRRRGLTGGWPFGSAGSGRSTTGPLALSPREAEAHDHGEDRSKGRKVLFLGEEQMKAVVVYESMYGNTRTVAEAIGAGLSNAYDVMVLPVDELSPSGVAEADLLVVGGPTHAHGMSRPTTRKAAAEAAEKPGAGVVLEGQATGPGVREWLDGLGTVPAALAAFDTRIKAPALVTGQASHGISKALNRHGVTEVVPNESFFVTKENQLLPGEVERARLWGAQVAAAASPGQPQPTGGAVAWGGSPWRR